MNHDETPDGITHLFAQAVRDREGAFVSSEWQAAATPDSVRLTYGFPFPESFPNEDLLAAAESLLETDPEHALQYGGGEASARLPDIVARRSRERGIECTEGEVVLTNGSMNAIDLACRAFLDPGDVVFLEAPTFVWSLSVIRNHGVEIVGIDVDSNGVDVDALAAELEERRRTGRPLPTLFYTIPNFQNPTGMTLSRSRRDRLLDLAAEYDFLVLEDDAYGELRYDGLDVEPLRAIDESGRVIHAGTFSKVIGPGIRTGWIIADDPVANRLDTLQTGGPNVFTRGLLTTYCDAGHLDAAVPRLREAYRQRRDHMLECLERHMPASADWTEPDGGFFVWVALPPTVDTRTMLEDAGLAGVVYLPGESFYATETGGEHCLRLSFSHVPFDEMERGIEALAETVEVYVDGNRSE